MLTDDERYMQACLDLANRGKGQVSPNPMVGAVLVRRGRIVARGYHQRFGGRHAEVECLQSYRGDVTDATLYVNLEPCSHFGKTPPCVEMLIFRGVSRVVIGMRDPNPLVAGKGIRRLRRAGVKVEVGVLKKKAMELNRAFVTGITKRRPFVHVKIAQSLDGLIASTRKRREWITCRESRKLVHQWRAEHDAVLVGEGTILADNPRLDVRLADGGDPDVVVLDGKFHIPMDSHVLTHKKDRRVFVCISGQALMEQKVKLSQLVRHGAIVLGFPTRSGRMDLEQVLRKLYAFNIGTLLVEGGSQVFSQFLYGGPVDQLSVFMAPKVFGKGVPALVSLPGVHRKRGVLKPGRVEVQRVGTDLLVQMFQS